MSRWIDNTTVTLGMFLGLHVEFECPDCGAVVRRMKKFCPDCGKNMEMTEEEIAEWYESEVEE